LEDPGVKPTFWILLKKDGNSLIFGKSASKRKIAGILKKSPKKHRRNLPAPGFRP
jgi:hypothetical protein